jgi:hypothetical protein
VAKQKGYGDEREYYFLEDGSSTGGIRKKIGQYQERSRPIL